MTLLFEKAEWDSSLLSRIYDACETIAVGEFGLEVYPNQLEVITPEQMLDAYASTGMPRLYKHWSFGKHFLQHEVPYRMGLRGLAYEIVINSSPCISYLMEENTATMQTLVIAHAAFGHNHFFKNNEVFRLWTDATSILDYLEFAEHYVRECEEKYGVQEVEDVLDAAHALMDQGVDRVKKPRKLSLKGEKERVRKRAQEAELAYNDLWRVTAPKGEKVPTELETEERLRRLGLLGGGEENILYFLEKFAPKLKLWQRELLRIVRMCAQYFYPQRHTKMMNEGCATYVHYQTLNRLHTQGLLGEGSMQEFFLSHTNVVFQPDFDDSRFSGFNPYALGFAMMKEIERIVTGKDDRGRPCSQEQLDEDRAWFGSQDWYRAHAGNERSLWEVLKWAWREFRDESFVSQFLSPRLMRQCKMFSLLDEESNKQEYLVTAIQDERGYRRIRSLLSGQYDPAHADLNIRVVDADLADDRTLRLERMVRYGVMLDPKAAEKTLIFLQRLWGYVVELREVDESGSILEVYKMEPPS